MENNKIANAYIFKTITNYHLILLFFESNKLYPNDEPILIFENIATSHDHLILDFLKITMVTDKSCEKVLSGDLRSSLTLSIDVVRSFNNFTFCYKDNIIPNKTYIF